MTLELLNDTADHLLDIVVDCQHIIKQLDDQNSTLYNDCVELHNKAVDLFNDLMERGVDRVIQ